MREIVNKLHENRQIELAKSILESNGYKVSKKSKGRRLNESNSPEFQILKQNSISYEESKTEFSEDFQEDTLENFEYASELLNKKPEDLFISLGDDARGFRELLEIVEEEEDGWVEGKLIPYSKGGYYSYQLYTNSESKESFVLVTSRDAYQLIIY